MPGQANASPSNQHGMQYGSMVACIGPLTPACMRLFECHKEFAHLSPPVQPAAELVQYGSSSMTRSHRHSEVS
jgi:hypothetical protein